MSPAKFVCVPVPIVITSLPLWVITVFKCSPLCSIVPLVAWPGVPVLLWPSITTLAVVSLPDFETFIPSAVVLSLSAPS